MLAGPWAALVVPSIFCRPTRCWCCSSPDQRFAFGSLPNVDSRDVVGHWCTGWGWPVDEAQRSHLRGDADAPMLPRDDSSATAVAWRSRALFVRGFDRRAFAQCGEMHRPFRRPRPRPRSQAISEPMRGYDPRTCGLRNRCSTTELHRRRDGACSRRTGRRWQATRRLSVAPRSRRPPAAGSARLASP
jgi:hypothetical protein